MSLATSTHTSPAEKMLEQILKKGSVGLRPLLDTNAWFVKNYGPAVVVFIPDRDDTGLVKLCIAEGELSWVVFYIHLSPEEGWRVAIADPDPWWEDKGRFQNTIGWDLLKLLTYCTENITYIEGGYAIIDFSKLETGEKTCH